MDNNRSYKIGEVAKLLELSQSTIRFWEKEFKQLKPIKSSAGQRFYTIKHIDLLKRLKTMLYEEKYTIDGAKKQLRLNSSKIGNEQNLSITQNISNINMSKDELKQELISILEILN